MAQVRGTVCIKVHNLERTVSQKLSNFETVFDLSLEINEFKKIFSNLNINDIGFNRNSSVIQL